MRRTLDHMATPAGGWTAAIGVVCILALVAALTLQFAFGFAPCHLCVWERWPYLVAAAAAVGALIVGTPRAALAAMAIILLGGTALAGFHVGVEQGVFALPESCLAPAKAQSIDELRNMLLQAPPRCDQVDAQLMGLSLATWNFVLSAALTLAAAAGFFWTRPASS